MTSQRNRPRRPSLSMAKPMSWLGGSKSSSSPIVISEPKLIHDIFIASSGSKGSHSPARYGPLGAGATVVRTPQDALSVSMRTQIITQQQQQPQQHHKQQDSQTTLDSDYSSYEEHEPPSPTSPPLPPLPFSSKSTPELVNISDMIPTSINSIPPLKLSSRNVPRTPPRSWVFLPPLVIPECPPQPTFAPILLSPPPDVLLDLPTLMVTIDTSTSSLRTTFSTLTSRPSYLTDYLSSIARAVQERERRKFRDTLVEADEEEELQQREEDGHSLPPPDTPFASLFTAHFNSAGLVPRSAVSIHMFLDRPSAPYTHILSYLRSPTSAPPILPRSAALSYSLTQERFDALLELRDEAKYLGLEELYQLCCDELRQVPLQFQGHIRASSASSTSHNLNTNTNSIINNNLPTHSIIIPGSLDQGRTPGMMRVLHEHQSPKLPNIVNRERHSGGSSSGAISQVAQVVEPKTVSPVSSPARSRSRGDPTRSVEGWI